jgi:hypothetical protein
MAAGATSAWATTGAGTGWGMRRQGHHPVVAKTAAAEKTAKAAPTRSPCISPSAAG